MVPNPSFKSRGAEIDHEIVKTQARLATLNGGAYDQHDHIVANWSERQHRTSPTSTNQLSEPASPALTAHSHKDGVCYGF
jgi:hypothetical protein